MNSEDQVTGTRNQLLLLQATYIRIYIYVYIYMYICIYIYTYTHIFTKNNFAEIMNLLMKLI